MQRACYTETADVESKLQLTGLSEEILREAVMVGQLRRTSCTANDPPSTPGTEAWRWTVRTLREILLPMGWERSDAANFSLVLNREKGVAIAVNTGDDGTGNPYSSPKTKHPKGPLTAAAASRNAQQLSLFEMDAAELPPESDLLTWLLLVAKDDKKVHYELFLPTNFKGGKPVGWKERIIFPPLDFAEQVHMQATQPEQAEIVVEVSRKAGT